MVILSRHFSQACKLPTALFNELGRWGGELGALVQGEMKETFQELYARACATTPAQRRYATEDRTRTLSIP